MPSRTIRSELLSSDGWLDITSDTVRVVYLHCLLLADDLGNLEGNRATMRRLTPNPVSDEAILKCLNELCDLDFLRRYEVDGKSYFHIPRFRQRVRYLKRANPRPPAGVECSDVVGSLDKMDKKSVDQNLKINKNNNLKNNSQTIDRPKTDYRPPEVEVEVEVEKEKRYTSPDGAVSADDSAEFIQGLVLPKKQPDCPHEKILALYAKHCPELPMVVDWNEKRQETLRARWRWVLAKRGSDGNLICPDATSALEFFDEFFQTVASSDFLMGRAKHWKADIDFLIRREKFLKILEGGYENREVRV